MKFILIDVGQFRIFYDIKDQIRIALTEISLGNTKMIESGVLNFKEILVIK